MNYNRKRDVIVIVKKKYCFHFFFLMQKFSSVEFLNDNVFHDSQCDISAGGQGSRNAVLKDR